MTTLSHLAENANRMQHHLKTMLKRCRKVCSTAEALSGALSCLAGASSLCHELPISLSHLPLAFPAASFWLSCALWFAFPQVIRII